MPEQAKRHLEQIAELRAELERVKAQADEIVGRITKALERLEEEQSSREYARKQSRS
jgi:hypothetical protein